MAEGGSSYPEQPWSGDTGLEVSGQHPADQSSSWERSTPTQQNQKQPLPLPPNQNADEEPSHNISPTVLNRADSFTSTGTQVTILRHPFNSGSQNNSSFTPGSSQTTQVADNSGYISVQARRPTPAREYRQQLPVHHRGNIQYASDDGDVADPGVQDSNRLINVEPQQNVKIYKLLSLYLLIPVIAAVSGMYTVSDKLCDSRPVNSTDATGQHYMSSDRFTCMRVTVAVALTCAIIALFVSAWYEHQYRTYMYKMRARRLLQN